MSQTGLASKCLPNLFSLVGRISLLTFHAKILIFWGTWHFQILPQSFLSPSGWALKATPISLVCSVKSIDIIRAPNREQPSFLSFPSHKIFSSSWRRSDFGDGFAIRRVENGGNFAIVPICPFCVEVVCNQVWPIPSSRSKNSVGEFPRYLRVPPNSNVGKPYLSILCSSLSHLHNSCRSELVRRRD